VGKTSHGEVRQHEEDVAQEENETVRGRHGEEEVI
jgi:hypothetical protein